MEGIYTALISPFESADREGINEKIWRKLIKRQIDAGISGIVVAGSTGEGQTLYPEEWKKLLKIAAEYSDEIHVMASVGSSSTWEVVNKIEKAKQLGAQSLLISTPAYNKPTAEGLYTHFKQASEASGNLPIMVYNIPGRTAVNISAETMDDLWKIPNIRLLKESSGNWGQFLEMQSRRPQDKAIFSGDDPSALSFWSHGALGLVSVASNVHPHKVSRMWTEFKDNNLTATRELFNSLYPLMKNLFVESNPIPVKYAVSFLLGESLPPRSPLTPLSEAHRDKIKQLLSKRQAI